jgi:hypothetical protein
MSTRLEHPNVRQVTENLGWSRTPSRSEYDLAIYSAGPAGLVDHIKHTPNIEIVPKTVIVALHGDDMLQAVALKSCETGELDNIGVDNEGRLAHRDPRDK